MTTVREDLITVLNGGVPQRTPLSIYDAFVEWTPDVREWRALVAGHGLAVCAQCNPVKRVERGVRNTSEERTEGASQYRISRKKTPVGTLQQVTRNGWHCENWIKTPADYRIRRWIVENTELVADYGVYHAQEDYVGERGVTVVVGSRSPAMSINVEWAGTEQFCADIAVQLDEMMDLYEAEKKLFLEETRLIAAHPGGFVKWGENLTVAMLGPRRYSDLLVSVYSEAVPLLEKAGKRVMVHYDGALRAVREQIAKAPFHIIESLTEPPEGDMTYEECRAAWPDKVLWGNINLGLYHLPKEQLRQEILDKRRRAGKRAFAFSISENWPHNWRENVPLILETLRNLD